MVYCGKASQGCQSCRVRRIKCDKVRPECSQCVRIARKCPGYRDQLSLMFRDENSKVMRKAHAQWGVDAAGAGAAAASPSSSSHRSTSAPAEPGGAGAGSSAPSPASAGDGRSVAVGFPLYARPGTPPSERGVQFYLNHYLLRYPDEPKTAQDVSKTFWFHEPVLQSVMAAVGLAGIANLKGDDEMRLVATQQYGNALQSTAKAIQNREAHAVAVSVRAVVMLALFEVVNERHESTEVVKKHIMGAAALIQNGMPFVNAPHGGVRGLIAVCCSLFIPCLVTAIPLPSVFFDWIQASQKTRIPDEWPAIDLVHIITRFVQLNAYIRHHALADGRPRTAEAIRALLAIDAQLEGWNAQNPPSWRFEALEAPGFPAGAVFRGQYHRYRDIYCARIWSHYRWARILVNQTALELAARYPSSGAALVSLPRQERMLAAVRRVGGDVLASTPTHYRDPRLSPGQLEVVQCAGGQGAGAVGIPAMLFHLKVAACAPGAPREYWEWSLGVMDTVWAEMGMLHARSLAEVMRAHRSRLESEVADGLLKAEPVA